MGVCQTYLLPNKTDGDYLDLQQHMDETGSNLTKSLYAWNHTSFFVSVGMIKAIGSWLIWLDYESKVKKLRVSLKQEF